MNYEDTEPGNVASTSLWKGRYGRFHKDSAAIRDELHCYFCDTRMRPIEEDDGMLAYECPKCKYCESILLRKASYTFDYPYVRDMIVWGETLESALKRHLKR